MSKISEYLNNIFKGKPERTQKEIEELKTLFRSRYHNFQLLLSANNNALEIMSEMEEALLGERVFSKSFVKSKTTSVLVNVYKIIKNLDELAPKQYSKLYEVFQRLKSDIDVQLIKRESCRSSKLILKFDEIDKSMSSDTGGKMANLGEIMRNTPYKVPQGFVVTAKASEIFFRHKDLQSEIDRIVQANHSQDIDSILKLSSTLQQLIINSSLPIEIEVEIQNAFNNLEEMICKGKNVSLRSSAIGEDSLGTSFAGQYSSRLNVTAQNILECYKEILASKYNLTAITYRMNKGIIDEDVSMCVGCMEMVDAKCGGVVYTGNPLDLLDDSIIINAVWGLPKAVVDGSVESDNYIIDRKNHSIIKKEIKYKAYKLILALEGGLIKEELSAFDAEKSTLTDERVLEIEKMALDIERHYGYPLDIEWAIDVDDKINILQCRPLQKFGHIIYDADDDDEQQILARIIKEGITASQGTAYGIVHIVEKDADMLSFPEKGILVIKQSLPRYASLLGRASAVIAEFGGIVGHLATVAREFNKPALFNVPNITKLLKTGQTITIDAGRKGIYDGKIESILKSHVSMNKYLQGSPVYNLLQKVSRNIVPLTMLNPESVDFVASNCQTLHDITRFCHEKSVQEMFHFGKSHNFSERTSKQLIYNKVPLKWWIINLDDGFIDDVIGNKVKIENIVSIPFKAIWDGIMAVPWSGPPSIDTKGFISILHQATINPDLDPSMKSQYSTKNYFLISKNFCSLTSRFGFHYATVESMLSERISENYTQFNFKGGAADLNRRVKRARFLGELLTEYGFYVIEKDDTINARAESLSQTEMEKRLKVIGYLLMHTRQLDMIMSNDWVVNNYRTKMKADIDTIVLQS